MSSIADEIRGRGLPKWPHMIVSGKPVTIDQAKDIIFRTDRFFVDESESSGGNNKRHNHWYRELAGLNKLRESYDGEISQHNYQGLYHSIDLLHEHLRCVHVQYLYNAWGSSAYIGGPHGWCNPSGVISFSDNIGKWPDISEVEESWIKIAKAFPYLELVSTLMNGEAFEDRATAPVVNFVIKNGTVELEDGNLEAHNMYDVPKPHKRSVLENIHLSEFSGREIGLPREWYQEYADRVHIVIECLGLVKDRDGN